MTMSTAQHQALMALRARFRRVLSAAMREREDRPQMADFGQGYEPRWASYERTVMHVEVNRARAEQGRDGVPLAAVLRVEQQACGHIDYFEKFAFYCAELVLGL